MKSNKKGKISDQSLEEASGGIKIPGFMKKGANKLMGKGKEYWKENKDSLIGKAKSYGKGAVDKIGETIGGIEL